MKQLLLLLFVWIPLGVFAQFSKTHYIPPLTSATNVSPQEQYLYISTASINLVKVKIIEIGGTTYNLTISKNSPIEHYIGFGSNTQLQVGKFSSGGPLNNKGYIVEAEDMVYVTARVLAGSYNQAGALVSKGLAALGTQFRVGAFINILRPNNQAAHLTFFSILATENNTEISITAKAGVTFVNPVPSNFTLNKGESFIGAVDDNQLINKDGLIGTLITANKPIAVNCGSFGGTNGEMSNIDLGFDQIVSAERTGKEYIFIKGNGLNNVEIPLIVAHEDNTEIFLNGNSGVYATLNAGEYKAINGIEYSANGNLYVRTSKNVFAYQGLGDLRPTAYNGQANQEMFFVPPLSCETPKIIDNIPKIDFIGNRPFTGSLSLITETGATLKIGINGTLYPITSLPPGISFNGPLSVIGNPNFVTYTLTGLSGNISVESTKQVYLSYYGSNGAASYGGFYSGFPYKPEVISEKITITTSNCIPNVELKLNTITAYDTFQWFFNDVQIPGATEKNYKPSLPGYYHVEGIITGCGTFVASDKIPVSSCPTDFDLDNINDNIDIDYDGDGILNCTESFGNTTLDFSNLTGGTITNNTYTNTFTGTTTTVDDAAAIPTQGFTDGSIVFNVPPKSADEAVTYQATFAKPISLQLDYPTSSSITGDFLTADDEFIIKVPVDKTITVLDPNGQLSIDTNYDGIFENGITEFSSFELRFRLRSSVPLPLGTGTFSFKTHLTESLSITHKNLSETATNKAIFKISATCIPYDTDADGAYDYADIDSDNDGILDVIEVHGKNYIPKSNIDLNKDGLDDAFVGLTPADSDSDGIKDYLDLDSDNDGIYDLIESGHTALDANNDGIVDGNLSDFGINGFLNSLETFADSFISNYTVLDTDTDGVRNFVDWDSDADNCADVIEAGFLDPNNDNFLGNLPITVNTKGLVTSGIGYITPHPNYLISSPIIINLQPQNTEVCELGTTVLSVQTNVIDSYQWQLSTNNGNTWTDLSTNATYNGVTTNQLQISNAVLGMQNYQYRVFLNKNSNTCGLYSSTITLTVNPLPIVNNVELFQCDDDTDGFTLFNLTEANQLISTNYLNETFTFYTTKLAAETADSVFLIVNPTNYNANSQTIWTRVTSNKACFRVAAIEIKVSTTNIPPGYMHILDQCDDFNGTIGSDLDGVASFDFSFVEADLRDQLPPTNQPITISYYRNLANALAESNPITDPANYRNIGYPTTQNIYIRIDSDIDNACLGLGHHITLRVNPIPIANPVDNLFLCDDIADGDDANGIVQYFDLGSQTATILGSQSPANFDLSYHASLADANSGANSLPLIYANTTRDNQTIYVRIVNKLTGCINPHLTFNLIVNPLPIIKTPTPLPLCDDLTDGDNRNGIVQSFNLNSKNAEILNGISPTQFLVTYHLNLADANSGVNSLASPYTNSNPNNQTLFVRVTNAITGCYNTKERLQLIVNTLPSITAIPDYELCDDANDGNDANGFVQSFNLESKTAAILGNQSATNFKVTYHRNQADANNGANPLASPFTNEIRNQQTIFIRITNLTTACFIADQSFKIVVKQKPVFEIDTQQIICLNNLPLRLFIKSELENYNYSWFDANGLLIASNTSSINITKGGKYTVKTSNALNCDRSIDIEVTESIIATISLDNITIVDNSSNNSITINNNNQEIGIGDYEYALDNNFGPYQDEPYFEQVAAGVRTLLIRDKNNCGIASIEIPIIGNPGFFTPNGDGYNDTWQILGIRLYPKSQIYIFDRYGKVLATISPTGIGWNGTHQGKQVDSGEYWFSAQLDNGRVIKGHFSLIRR